MMELDQKALEAARLAAWSKRDGGNIDFDAAIDTAIRAYLLSSVASLPSDDEVGRVCERLRGPLAISGEHRDEAAALIQSQADELAAVKAEMVKLSQSWERQWLAERDLKCQAIAAQRRAEAALAEANKENREMREALEPFAEAGRAMLMTGGKNPKLSGPRLAEHLDAARRAHSNGGKAKPQTWGEWERAQQERERGL